MSGTSRAFATSPTSGSSKNSSNQATSPRFAQQQSPRSHNEPNTHGRQPPQQMTHGDATTPKLLPKSPRPTNNRRRRHLPQPPHHPSRSSPMNPASPDKEPDSSMRRRAAPPKTQRSNRSISRPSSTRQSRRSTEKLHSMCARPSPCREFAVLGPGLGIEINPNRRRISAANRSKSGTVRPSTRPASSRHFRPANNNRLRSLQFGRKVALRRHNDHQTPQTRRQKSRHKTEPGGPSDRQKMRPSDRIKTHQQCGHGR